jgi:hypothetical protein
MIELSQGIPLATCVQAFDEAESLQSAELNPSGGFTIQNSRRRADTRGGGPTLLARTRHHYGYSTPEIGDMGAPGAR